MKENSLVLFQGNKVRRKWLNEEWWFVISDIIKVLTESVNPSDYLKKLRKRDPFLGEAFKGGGQFVPPLGMEFDTPGGRQMLQCWNTTGILRLAQSIPSPKAEPFKLWLAQVGYERIQEIENPELAQDRAKQYYELKGYPKDWIEKRLRGIAVRQELTTEWKQRGVDEQKEYAILTNEISQATFGLPISEHKTIKNINPQSQQNLRDHMTDLELIFSMLGEKISTEITKNEDKKGFSECQDAAKRGGNVAGKAREETEKEIGHKVVSSKNYLDLRQTKKLEKK